MHHGKLGTGIMAVAMTLLLSFTVSLAVDCKTVEYADRFEAVCSGTPVAAEQPVAMNEPPGAVSLPLHQSEAQDAMPVPPATATATASPRMQRRVPGGAAADARANRAELLKGSFK
jgi:hypothetical protein